MKCPNCSAQLLPVDGEMFCLQCGESVHEDANQDMAGPVLEETTDPVLQRAIVDASKHPTKMQFLPKVEPTVAPKTAFSSMQKIFAQPHPMLAGAGVMSAPAGMVEAHEPVAPAGAAALPPAEKAEAPTTPMPISSPDMAVAAQAGAALALARVVAGVPAPVVAKPEEIAMAAVASSAVAAAPAKPSRLSIGWHAGPNVIAWAATALSVLVLGNVALSWYFQARVYPGVRVGQMALGGLPIGQLHDKLVAGAPKSAIKVVINTTTYSFTAADFANPTDMKLLERRVREAGRTTPLPMAGAIETLVSKPLNYAFAVDPDRLNKSVAQLATGVNFVPTDALPMILAGRAFVISEKAGSSLDTAKAAADIAAAFGHKPELSLAVRKLTPIITAAAYRADIDQAQAQLGLSLQIKVKTQSYSPSASQVGDWLVFRGPGRGTAVNGAKVAAYVNTIPGKFDRAGATNALIAGVGGKQPVAYTASAKASATPSLPDITPSLPLISMNYCLQAPAASLDGFRARVLAALADAKGWRLGGRLNFVAADDDCGLILKLASSEELANLDPGCATRASCQVGNTLAFNQAVWTSPQSGWTAGAEAYQNELIQHETGHWLGFEHISCIGPASSPILETPVVVTDGCSPNWYPVPAEVQGTKLLGAL